MCDAYCAQLPICSQFVFTLRFTPCICHVLQGVGSDLYVVKGTEIGHEIVSVHLLEPQLEHVADEIVLTVVEAISLDPPSPVFVIIGASIRYTLRVIRQNTPQGSLIQIYINLNYIMHACIYNKCPESLFF